MKIHLKKGEKLYLNGAVLQVDNKCSVQLLNNATFLLENHVMQPEAASTPFEQLYFVIQTILMDPENEASTRQMYWHLSDCLRVVLESPDLINGLNSVDELIKIQKYFDALKKVRGLFTIEKTIVRKTQLHPFQVNSQQQVA